MRTDPPPGPMSRVSATTADPYLLGHHPSEQERLLRQADVPVDEANRLLDEIDLPPGAHVVDVRS